MRLQHEQTMIEPTADALEINDVYIVLDYLREHVQESVSIGIL